MKNSLFVRQYLNAALLLSTVILLAGCAPLEWLKQKTGCQTCEHPAGSRDHAAGSGPVIATFDNGKKSLTLGDYEVYWDEFLESDPQAKAIIPFMPNARYELFKNFVTERVIQEWIKREKKDKDAAYVKKINSLYKNLERGMAVQAFQEYVLEKVDKSDAAAERFYNENRDTQQIFQQQPFMQTPAGVKLQAVQFSDEKQAKDFLAKAQQPNANFSTLAKDAKKKIENFGNNFVNATSTDVDRAIKAKVADIKEVPSVDFVQSGKNFWVIKATDKQEAQYAPFEEVKDAVKQAKLRVEFPEALTKEIENLKKDFNVNEDTGKTYFEEERKKEEAKTANAAPDQADQADMFAEQSEEQEATAA